MKKRAVKLPSEHVVPCLGTIAFPRKLQRLHSIPLTVRAQSWASLVSAQLHGDHASGRTVLKGTEWNGLLELGPRLIV